VSPPFVRVADVPVVADVVKALTHASERLFNEPADQFRINPVVERPFIC
jgi:hypothetical protein